jgi:manganese transport system ATP-binding protein
MESINYQNFRIDAENICVDYNGKVALYDANLRLKPGQICGLVGMNGAGKTTFFNALTGFVNISKGKIRINGESVRSAQKDQTIAYVPQNEGIDSQFPISVWDVVMMLLRELILRNIYLHLLETYLEVRENELF